MTEQRWQRISETFDAALQYRREERTSFLSQACKGDEALQSEVARLLAEFERANDFLERPPASSANAAYAGDIVGGRYRIEAMLGHGGMGEVYRAHDQLLDEKVAIKMLRPELFDTPGILKRFQREVQLARRVTHTSVCRVFEADIHVQGERRIHFFAMQLVEGETLSARIRRTGRLSREEARPLIINMAEGLHAAHQAGVIHRDFKSSNVILCNGNAVIMDFGLAMLDPTEARPAPAGTFTSSMQLAGTVAYMSPEQLSGGEVTPASDIYSLGVVLFEMATGQLPFDDKHIIHSAMQRASDSVPSVRALAPDVDAEWARVVGRCLRRDPAKRFRSAAEIARHFRGGASRRLALHAMPHWTRRQWALAAGVTISAAAVSSVPWPSRLSRSDAKLPEGAEVLVSRITNSTGDARFEGITELFRDQVAQSVHLNLIDNQQLGNSLTKMGKAPGTMDSLTVREAGWRINAALSIFGNVSRVGPDYSLEIQLETRGSQPDRPRSKSHNSWTASDPEGLMRTVRDASLWVRETVGESAAGIASFDRLPADATTPSWEALRYYARGEKYFMLQDFEPAILEFEAALRVDPKFTLAALRRADLLVSQGRQTEGFPQWRSAIQMLGQRQVTRPEELNARGMFALDTGDINAADRYFRTWSAEYPFDWRAPFYRMLPLVLSGHAAEALDLLTRLRKTMPDYGDIYAQMITCHLILGQTNEARQLVPEVRKWNRPERADMREAYIRFREGNCIGCLEILRSIQRSSYRRGAADAMLQEALLCIDAGFPEAAAVNIERFLSAGSWIETAPEQVSLRIVQAWGELLTGRHRLAIEHARMALEAETGPMVVTLAGSVFARVGARSLAERALVLCAGLLDLPISRIARHRILGELARVEGRENDAVAEFRNAAALEPSIAHRQYLIEALPEPSVERLELCMNVVRIPWQAVRPPPLHCLGSLAIAVPIVNGMNDSTGALHAFAKTFADSSRKLGTAI